MSNPPVKPKHTSASRPEIGLHAYITFSCTSITHKLLLTHITRDQLVDRPLEAAAGSIHNLKLPSHLS